MTSAHQNNDSHNVMTERHEQDGWHHGHHGHHGGVDEPHPDNRFRGQHRETIGYDLLVSFYNFKLSVFPVVFFIGLVGMILSIITARRRKIRKYSSAVYLAAIIVFDNMLVFFSYLPKFLMEVIELVEFNDQICMWISAMNFIGIMGTCIVVVLLVVERIFVLRYPTKYCTQVLSTPRVALLMSVIVLLMVTGLSGSVIYGTAWKSDNRFCSVLTDDVKSNESPQNLIPIILVFCCTGAQLILNSILGYILHRRRKNRLLDPVHNSTSQARQRTDQLNKINLISFIMSLDCLIVNIPDCVYLILVWYRFWEHFQPITRLIVVSIIELISLLLLVSKPFIVALVSKKIRKEAYLALCCTPENNRVRELGIEINPKKIAEKAAKQSDLDVEDAEAACAGGL